MSDRKTMHDLDIDFIRMSESPGEAADTAAECIMSECGTDKNGFWSKSNAALLALIMYYVATSEDVTERNIASCCDLIADADTLGKRLKKETEAHPEDKYLKKRYEAWDKSGDREKIAEITSYILGNIE